MADPSRYALLVLGLSAACGDAAPAARWSGSFDTLATGTVVVTSLEAGVWDEDSAWRLERVARIGSVEGGGAEMFGRIGGIELGDGVVYVLDAQASEVRVFDFTGGFVRRFGGEGGGPGEFRAPVWLERGSDGRVWVADIRSRRLTAFDSTGDLSTTLDWGSYGGFFGAHRLTDSELLEEVGLIERVQTERGRVDRFAGRAVIRRLLGDSGRVADTLRLPSFDAPTFTVERTLPNGVATYFYAVPYAPRSVTAIGPDGAVWTGRTDEYRIARVTIEGDTTRIVRRLLDPTPVTDEDIERAFDRADDLRDAGVELEPGVVPATKPFFTDVLVDDRGGLWIRRVNDPAGGDYRAEEPQPAWYDVFDPDGRFLGRLPSPVDASPPPRITRDHLVGVTRDSFDVQYVEVYRIARPEG